jgi:hypothetical protein
MKKMNRLNEVSSPSQSVVKVKKILYMTLKISHGDCTHLAFSNFKVSIWNNLKNYFDRNFVKITNIIYSNLMASSFFITTIKKGERNVTI